VNAVIAAGGTGGHIFPGLALADALKRTAPDTAVTFVGTERGLEKRLVPEAGYPLRYVDMVPFTGVGKVTLPFALARAALQSRKLLKAERADVAVGMGGYASIPLIVGARLAGVPALIHESGAIAGRANRVAGLLTHNVALAFDEAAHQFKGRARTVGMPLNPQIADFDRVALRAEARTAFGLAARVTMVLVSGGSQGSARLNEAAVGMAGRWKDRDDVRIVLKAGAANADEVSRRLSENGGTRVAQVVSFFDRMDHAYAAADLMVSRAGAGTVAELAAVGLPSILVPYPYAPDDHQAVNASVLTKAGAAVMVRDEDATADRLAPMVEELLADPERLRRMGQAMGGLARPRAADEIADELVVLARHRTSAY
jgi:UDP-N-acetylglucosamine--N-acetylmuramyl-(pentapeptide) pyrophosphoryl-undecaprenol N-acetylglucosamine transferase